VLESSGTECCIFILGIVAVTNSVTDRSQRNTVAGRHLCTVEFRHGITRITSCNRRCAPCTRRRPSMMTNIYVHTRECYACNIYSTVITLTLPRLLIMLAVTSGSVYASVWCLSIWSVYIQTHSLGDSTNVAIDTLWPEVQRPTRTYLLIYSLKTTLKL